MRKLTVILLVIVMMSSLVIDSVAEPVAAPKPLTVTLERLREVCADCGVEKSWRVMRLFCPDSGEVIAERRAAKRDSAGALLMRCESPPDPRVNHDIDLSPEVQTRIMNEAFEHYRHWTNIGNVRILHYFGTYDGSVVLMLNKSIQHAGWSAQIAGREFRYPNSNATVVRTNGEFHHLHSFYEHMEGSYDDWVFIPGAYELGLLTQEDIEKIHEHHIQTFYFVNHN
jgi:hypothetical protein